MKKLLYLGMVIAFFMLSNEPIYAQITTTVDIDGDGVDDLSLSSSFRKVRGEWGATKKSSVTNLTDQPVQFDWPVGGQSGIVQLGKTVKASWVSWTAVFVGTGNVLANKAGVQKTQKTSAYNCISDILKDWETSTSNFGTTASIPDEPASLLLTEFSVDDTLSLLLLSDCFPAGDGQFQYIYGAGNFSDEPIHVNWRAARNNNNPTGINMMLLPGEYKNDFYITNSPPSFYGNFTNVMTSQGDILEIDAPAWVPSGEISELIGENSTNLYQPDRMLEDFEDYTDTQMLEMNWEVTNQGKLFLEMDADPFDAASNVNNEPPLFGLGENEINFNGQNCMGIHIQPGLTDIIREDLNQENLENLIIWAMLPDSGTVISLLINDGHPNNIYVQENQIMLPQIGGFVGYHFEDPLFQNMNRNINSITIKINSPTAQTIFIDEIVGTKGIIDQVDQFVDNANIKFDVYPNPTSAYLNISIEGTEYLDNHSVIFLFSPTGKLVNTWIPNRSDQFSNSYSIKGLSSGVYSLVFRHKNGLIAKRVQLISD